MAVLVGLNYIVLYRVLIFGLERHFQWFWVIEISVLMATSNTRKWMLRLALAVGRPEKKG